MASSCLCSCSGGLREGYFFSSGLVSSAGAGGSLLALSASVGGGVGSLAGGIAPASAGGAVVGGLTVQGALSRLSRAEGGLMRALSSGQSEDGGLVSRSPEEQALLVDRLGLTRAAYFAAKQTLPDQLENAAAAALAALHGVTMGDGSLSSWQGSNPGDPARLAALVEGCGLRARPLRQARGASLK